MEKRLLMLENKIRLDTAVDSHWISHAEGLNGLNYYATAQINNCNCWVLSAAGTES